MRFLVDAASGVVRRLGGRLRRGREKRTFYRDELQIGVGVVVIGVRSAGVPLAAIGGVAFDFMQQRVDPAGDGIVFVSLHDFMRAVPVAAFRGSEGLWQIGRHGAVLGL